MNSNYGWGLPIQASTFAKEIDLGIGIIHAAMLGIFILWSVFFVYLLLRYKQRDGRRAEYKEEGVFKSLIPDALVLVFEIGLIVFYAVPSWSRIKMQFPKPEDSHAVHMVAEQFAWSVHYPGADGQFGRRRAELVNMNNVLGLDPNDAAGQDDFVTVNELHIPLGKPTLMKLSSKDVVHSFFVPELRIKQDATPGMEVPVWFEPTQTGRFEIACAQLCGFGHAMMRGDLYVHTPQDYESWSAQFVKKPQEKQPAEAW